MIQRIRRNMKMLRADSHIREMARGTLSSLVARSLGTFLVFLFSVILTRFLGAENSGLFFLAMSVVLIAETIGRFGLDYSLVRFVSACYAKEDWGGVFGVWRHGIRIGLFSSALMMILLAVTAWPIANYVFAKPELYELLLLLSFTVVPLALTKVYAAALRGMKRIFIFQLLQNALALTVVITLVIPLISLLGWELGVTLSYLIGWVAALCAGWWFWRAAMASLPHKLPCFDYMRLMSSSPPMLAVSLSAILLTQLPLFFIGYWSDSKDVAIFNVAARVAFLGTFLLQAVISILSPKFSELIVSNRLGELELLSRRSVFLATLFMAPIWIVVVIFPGQILSMFGEEFREGTTLLVVMFSGQMLFGFFGIGSEILVMGGYERLVRRSLFLAVIICTISSLFLVPKYSGFGSALAISLAYLGHAGMCQFYVHRHFNFWPIPFVARSSK